VAALWMETGRTPYVVTTDGIGGVDREVPWRRGTALRSAHRSDILRSVVREAQAPQFDAISGWVRVERARGSARTDMADRDILHPSLQISYSLTAYVEAREPVRLPEYRWSMHLVARKQEFALEIAEVSGPRMYTGQSQIGFRRYEPVGSIVYVPESGLHINGSDIITLSGHTVIQGAAEDLGKLFARAQRVNGSARFPIALSSRHGAVDAVLRRSKRTEMRGSSTANFRYVDDRIGEFTYGSGQPYEYQGLAVRVEPRDG
jgi:hypothetical protein